MKITLQNCLAEKVTAKFHEILSLLYFVNTENILRHCFIYNTFLGGFCKSFERTHKMAKVGIFLVARWKINLILTKKELHPTIHER